VVRKLGLPIGIGFVIAHVPHELDLPGQPCVKVTGADLRDMNPQ
jgi:hypothetical protein